MARRWWAIMGWFGLVLCLSLTLSACDNGQNIFDKISGSSQALDIADTRSANGGQSEGAASYPVHLKMLYPGMPQLDEAVVEEVMNEYLKDKINAVIDLQPIDWTQWDNDITLRIASGEEMDIIFTAQWNGHALNVSKGVFVELENLLPKYGQGILNTLDPTFLQGARINGKNYAVPTNKELAVQGGVIYRSDIADELHLDMSKVKTVDDLGPILEQVKQKRPDFIPLALRQGENFNAHYFTQFDYLGDIFLPGVIDKTKDNKTVVPLYELAQYKTNLKITREFMQKGYINADAATTSMSTGEFLKNGNTFMITSSLTPGKAEELASAYNLQGKLKQIVMTERTVSTGEITGSMLGISATSQHPEEAMMFINLLHTDKYLNNLINFGIEGVHYTRNGEIITATERTKDYAPGASWMFGNQFLNYLWDTEDPQKWEKLREFNNGVKKSIALGFTVNADKIKTEGAVIQSILKQYDPVLDTGMVDPDKILPEYIELLKAAGIDKIIADKQLQFDQYLASK
ncbi:ABC transporter substrate-binding protein [Paenibacillus sp. NPDC058174]|uniref:ABC transporter substrate-binding protein n=1 Tax=Paenibacillus sp. NPDC058174 TaxID=3346366 RepID=UPI0036DBD501